MSIGRIGTFIDVGDLDERGAQELIDQLVIKLRIVRLGRKPATAEPQVSVIPTRNARGAK